MLFKPFAESVDIKKRRSKVVGEYIDDFLEFNIFISRSERILSLSISRFLLSLAEDK